MRFVATLAALGLLTVPAFAAPTAAQKGEFYRVCMSIAQDATLCGCKADAAMTLIDERFMGVVIASMKGTASPASGLQRLQYLRRQIEPDLQAELLGFRAG